MVIKAYMNNFLRHYVAFKLYQQTKVLKKERERERRTDGRTDYEVRFITSNAVEEVRRKLEKS